MKTGTAPTAYKAPTEEAPAAECSPSLAEAERQWANASVVFIKSNARLENGEGYSETARNQHRASDLRENFGRSDLVCGPMLTQLGIDTRSAIGARSA